MTENTRPQEPSGFGQIGRRLTRREDDRFIGGTGRFVDDLEFPGMLHGVLLRSAHAHARILSIDAEEARSLPGVRLVLTAQDLAESGISTVPLDFPPPGDHGPDWAPPARLADFLSSGPAPVYVGFGSVRVNPGGWDKHNAPDPMMQTIIDAAVKSRRRAVVLASGHAGDVTGLPDNVCLMDPVPFDWLYPRMAATVHHGGAGTAGAAFRAGVPSAVVPFTAFQPFWGRRVHALGAGPVPVPRNRLTASKLAAAIRTATSDHNIKRRAEELGSKIRAERGIGRAVELIDQYLRA